MVLIYYLVIDILYASLVVTACRQVMNRFGIKRSLQASVLFGAIYYLTLFSINHYLPLNGTVFSLEKVWFLVPALFFSLSFRLTHWIPFQTNLAKLTDRGIRARQLSLMEATMMVLGAIMPIVAGLILESLGYSYLFIIAVAVYLLSLLPFSLLPKVEESFSWNYRKTFKTLFSKKMRSSVVAYMGDGAESVAGTVIWPIFIWQLLEGNYFQVGLISSLIIVFTILLQFLIGRRLDKMENKRQILRYGTLFYSFGWILKALIGSAFQVFLFSTYHNLSRVFSRTSFDSLNYDIAADQGHYVDEYTVVREISILFGKILMAIFIIILLPHFALRHIFILAALASLMMSFLKQVEHFDE